MTAFTTEERAAFFGSIARDATGSEHLLGLTSAETNTYLVFRRMSLAGETVVGGVAEHVALYERHRHACKLRLIEPGE